ncbi:MAG: Aspartyl/glutamyl-tRNA(Asn/Gln) amidotransferase subunit B [Candidatus Anoxychlamydiales bacterium]|nr:Aspartyl/glutamyl-tRNA(Asn/Gln) amidotransferase subunit B [Candidatus Anoxychlamydiales bacterium]NGX40942.1 Aspartyl/glutamyl-tRNA(Asn/Gln) amidotransferase subunit B [Candidatus Anoxychlamydiales bacterium]HEU63933.1 Asp-tRNA(Asn)/Glu-tRNA(Gln) amidotransferase subunit GatB [Chlamydiota bacterium]
MTDDTAYDMYEPVIGLEIHVQLNTASKLFSSALNRFGDEPNTNISEVCTGQPGALPVLNEEAVKKAILFGLAVKAKISNLTTFDRKSYFYPDSPRNFQITQFNHPIITGGSVISDVGGETKRFQISEAHLEDDTGMLKHFDTFAGVDYNRAGTPLLEIVSMPCIHSPKEASSYAMAIRSIMQYIGASDCSMEEGSLRIDANVSVRPKGEKDLRSKIEVKNMNSFNFLEMAIESEIRRQIRLYEQNPNTPFDELIPQATYRWDVKEKRTVLMRRKEKAEDYRYFPEPDLVPIVLTEEYISEIEKDMPELPHKRFERYTKKLNLTNYDASILIIDKKLSDYFEEALKTCRNAKLLCNLITVEFLGKLKEKNLNLFSIKIPPLHLAKLVNLIDSQTITGKIAKSVADDMIEDPEKDPEKIVKENPNYRPITDEAEIEKIVDQVLKENPNSIKDYLSGRDKALAFLVGQVMKITKGKASPGIVNKFILTKIKKLK